MNSEILKPESITIALPSSVGSSFAICGMSRVYLFNTTKNLQNVSVKGVAYIPSTLKSDEWVLRSII